MSGLRASETVRFLLRLKGVRVDAVDVVEHDVVGQRIRRRRNDFEDFGSAGGGDHRVRRRHRGDDALDNA